MRVQCRPAATLIPAAGPLHRAAGGVSGGGVETHRDRVRGAGGKRERRGDRRDREKRQADRKKEGRREEKRRKG